VIGSADSTAAIGGVTSASIGSVMAVGSAGTSMGSGGIATAGIAIGGLTGAALGGAAVAGSVLGDCPLGEGALGDGVPAMVPATIAAGASANVVAELARAQAAADDRVETRRHIAQLISRGA
jgi:hypothetical protein